LSSNCTDTVSNSRTLNRLYLKIASVSQAADLGLHLIYIRGSWKQSSERLRPPGCGSLTQDGPKADDSHAERHIHFALNWWTESRNWTMIRRWLSVIWFQVFSIVKLLAMVCISAYLNACLMFM
jgi:hypothetical protein